MSRALVATMGLGLLVALTQCGPSRPPPTYTPMPRARATRPREEPRASIGGFVLGDGFASAALDCSGRRHRFDRDPGGDSGTCSGTPDSVGYPVESAFLRSCEGRLCQITVRVRVEGEAQLQRAIDDVTRAWGQRYGETFADAHRNAVPGASGADCIARLGEGRVGCLLRGTAMFVRNWNGPAAQLREGERAQLVASGSAGSEVATIRLTLATREGVNAAGERDL